MRHSLFHEAGFLLALYLPAAYTVMRDGCICCVSILSCSFLFLVHDVYAGDYEQCGSCGYYVHSAQSCYYREYDSYDRLQIVIHCDGGWRYVLLSERQEEIGKECGA